MSGQMLSLKTIEDMEANARQEADGSSNKRIRDEWLEVRFVNGYVAKYPFTYKWGKNMVSRNDAKAVLATA